VSSRRLISEGGSLARWGARAQVIVGTTRHEFAYRWTTPRSATPRTVVVALVVVVGLLVVLLGLLALAVALLVTAVAIAALAVASLVRQFARLRGSARRDRRHTAKRP
jgi:hypothetical protein